MLPEKADGFFSWLRGLVTAGLSSPEKRCFFSSRLPPSNFYQMELKIPNLNPLFTVTFLYFARKFVRRYPYRLCRDEWPRPSGRPPVRQTCTTAAPRARVQAPFFP